MAGKKILYISQEIAPYLPATPMSTACRELPQGIQERGNEVRTFMPKYGAINERRNQLHEVIRLSGMNLIIDDTDHPLIIKVATLLPARMQVYFIYNDDYFVRNIVKELETTSSTGDNDERSIFFVRGVLETVKKLRWAPSTIHCSGWITALAPLYIKNIYRDDPSFAQSKIVYSLFGDQPVSPLGARLAEKVQMDGIVQEDIAGIAGKPVGGAELDKLAIAHCDGVIQHTDNINPEILDYVKASGKPLLQCQNVENYVEACAAFYDSL